MFSRILTFSILSVFCVFTAISYVYAHEATGEGSSNPHWHNLCHDHGGYSHCHLAVVHGKVENGVYSEVYKPGFNHADEHNNNPSKILRVGRPPEENVHTHTFVESHQHDNYEWHAHEDTHDHPDSEHPHPPNHPFHVTHADVGIRTDTTVDEQPVNQPTGNQPTGNQPTGNQPTGNQPTGTQPTTVVESGTSEGTSEAGDSGTPVDTSTEQNFLRAQQKYGTPLEGTPETQPKPQPLLPIRITEYMVRDWSAGIGGLPQWIEVYNPNTEAVNLKGWTFQYATRRSANAPHKVHTLTLAGTQDGFSIAGGGVAILSTRKVPAWRFSGIGASQVYNLSIDNVLKRGWVLTDADGKEIQRLGREAFSAFGDPVAPLHQNKARVSHQVLPSESPPEVYYYGHREDIGSPGFYEQPAPAAPSAVRRKQIGTWAALKK